MYKVMKQYLHNKYEKVQGFNQQCCPVSPKTTNRNAPLCGYYQVKIHKTGPRTLVYAMSVGFHAPCTLKTPFAEYKSVEQSIRYKGYSPHAGSSQNVLSWLSLISVLCFTYCLTCSRFEHQWNILRYIRLPTIYLYCH